MTKTEAKYTLILSTILSLRLFGVFAVLPILSIYAFELTHPNPTLIGVALGIYGLTQAIFQIPMGSWSDKVGRKKIISLGIIIFIFGSIIAAQATSIFGLILGRALQGSGAIGSTASALLADITKEEHRNHAMAMLGINIGLSFSIALIAGPSLIPHTGIKGIFWLSAFFGILSLFILRLLPSATPDRKYNFSIKQSLNIIKIPQLNALFISIFLLHMIFTASFVVLPLDIKTQANLSYTQQWIVYVPTLLFALILSIIILGYANRKNHQFSFFLMSILLLGIGEIILWLTENNLFYMKIGLVLFFTGFSTLEAMIPANVSKIAPKDRRGMAMGLHSCCQFLGIFVGGVLGGKLYSQNSFATVYLFCILITCLWSLKIIAYNTSYANWTYAKEQDTK